MENGENAAYPIHMKSKGIDVEVQGLSKREYFAGLAMQGLLGGGRDVLTGKTIQNEIITELSVSMADALIEALNKAE